MSQLDPLPGDLPFRVISKTIGRGAYASIKKAIPLQGASPVFAVKFIHKAYAVKHGRVSLKQINMEVTLHQHVGKHQNIIEFFASGEDPVWRWIAMEYAEGGDLFDKIEADVGVSEDIAHFYFTQLMSGVSWMHDKGVGHRDLKPENILLSANGDLKIADFGLATLFVYKGKRKESSTMCGSPPYIAPEVISCRGTGNRSTQSPRTGYAGDRIDIWSCGVVLFVLLVGNTPWDEPTPSSYEYAEYAAANGKSSTDPLWQKPPPAVLSLLRGMMKIDPSTRYTSAEVRRHPWFTRSNPYLDPSGGSSTALSLATDLLTNLKIDMSQEPTLSQPQVAAADTMDVDDSSDLALYRLASTQPEIPVNDIAFDFVLPSRADQFSGASASQPVPSLSTSSRSTLSSSSSTTTTTAADTTSPSVLRSRAARHPTHAPPVKSTLADLPSMSQFSQNSHLPFSLTQHAQRFQDIVPSHSLTTFVSHLPREPLLQLLAEALHRVGVPTSPPRELPPAHQQQAGRLRGPSLIKVKAVDSRRCGLLGDIVVEGAGVLKEGYESQEDREEGEFLEVRFVKVKGDPVEWRRLFKNVVRGCREGVFVAENDEGGG